MPTLQDTEKALAPELEAIAAAADQRLRAEADETLDDTREQHAVAQAAGSAIAAGHPIAAVANAEQIGQARARDALGSDLLRRAERAARRKRDAEADYEQAIARAARLGLAHRDIATAAQIAHGTIRSILARAAHANRHVPTAADVSVQTCGTEQQ